MSSEALHLLISYRKMSAAKEAGECFEWPFVQWSIALIIYANDRCRDGIARKPRSWTRYPGASRSRLKEVPPRVPACLGVRAVPDQPGLQLFPSFRLSVQRRPTALLSNVILSLNYSARVARPSCCRPVVRSFICPAFGINFSAAADALLLSSVAMLHICVWPPFLSLVDLILCSVSDRAAKVIVQHNDSCQSHLLWGWLLFVFSIIQKFASSMRTVQYRSIMLCILWGRWTCGTWHWRTRQWRAWQLGCC